MIWYSYTGEVTDLYEVFDLTEELELLGENELSNGDGFSDL